MEMMRSLRHVNIDHLHVGWYQSTYYGSFVSRALLDSQFSYQHAIEESVVLIYDPIKTAQGSLSLKAYRLTPKLMEICKEKDFTPEALKKANIGFEHMFEEVPIIIKNSHLINVLMWDLEDKSTVADKHELLNLSSSNHLEKSLQLLMDRVDDMSQDIVKYNTYSRNLSKQQQQKHQDLQRPGTSLIYRLSALHKSLHPLPVSPDDSSLSVYLLLSLLSSPCFCSAHFLPVTVFFPLLSHFIPFPPPLHLPDVIVSPFLFSSRHPVFSCPASRVPPFPFLSIFPYLQRRTQENAQRQSRGEPPLPEEDISKMFKPPQPPPRMDTLLIAGQINNYCQNVKEFTSQNLGKLFMAEALQGHNH
ncbi:hypothetical protein FQN60_016927 [Etheostoma spectabile]|uniref:MPN domain-containing protein n=1 Tax=Etheostoma spectabile TaxID=54343 RepID=A0A5J5DE17_9PERO|nr:hypothetical protein FQN60_016927 [Etheostoma spectabile]